MNKKRIVVVIVLALLLPLVALLFFGSGLSVVERGVAVPGSAVTVDVLRLKGSSGFRAFERGRRTDSEVTFPRLPVTNAFWRAVNEYVQEQAVKDVAEFGGGVTWREVWGARQRQQLSFLPESTYEWQMNGSISPEWVSPQLVSMVFGRWCDTGGTRPWGYSKAINVVQESGSFRTVQLGEFFRKDAEWREILAVRMTEIMNQEKRRIYGHNMTAHELTKAKPDEVPTMVFTVNPTGFRFWNAPFKKSEVDSDFEPEIPYSDVMTILDTNGPAKWLPCWPAARP